jgi:hypothetical protein
VAAWAGAAAEGGHILVGNDFAVTVDQQEFSLALPDSERAALDEIDEDRAGQAPFDRHVLDPGEGFDTVARGADREAEDRVAGGNAESGAQQWLGRIGAAVDDNLLHPQIDVAGEGFLQPGGPAAGFG